MPELLPPAGLILASGLSRRFGEENKLLVPLHGKPIVTLTVEVYVAAALRPVAVVVGHDANRVRAALHGLSVQLVLNPDFVQGQSRALVRGIASLPLSTPAVVVGVADQPLLQSSVIVALEERWRTTGAPIVVPRYGGRRGNPVLFDRSLFPELLQVKGDQGGRPVTERHRDLVAWIDVPDPAAGLDVDTPEEYDNLLGTTSGE